MIEFAEDNARKPGVLFTEINDNNTDVYEDGVRIGYIYRTTDHTGNECWVYYDSETYTHFWDGRGVTLEDAKCRLPRELKTQRAAAISAAAEGRQ